MQGILDPSLAALLQVILIDVVLAGDNAVVIGLAAGRLPPAERNRAMVIGMAIAVVLRIALALGAAHLLAIIGLMFSGGLLLLWVSFRLYRDIAEHHANKTAAGEEIIVTPQNRTSVLRAAIVRIVVADVSMSLDNVLAVAGAAENHLWVLVAGLLLSIALMGFAATLIAKLLQRQPWISYAGLLVVIYVALRMIWFGGWEIFDAAT